MTDVSDVPDVENVDEVSEPEPFNPSATPSDANGKGSRRKLTTKPTEALRSQLLVSAWLTRKLPPRDYLLGDVLCTTSRWLIFGETGIGKTLIGLDIAGAVAAGQSFLNWRAGRRTRVMCLDGELPGETFKERMQLVASGYGDDVLLWGYSRDALEDDDMPPLNTPEGVAWLVREIDVVRPDLIVFDSIMCLLDGTMSDEESWAPVKLLMRQLSARRIAQIWLHHAGHDASKGFGTKTREWEMDTVIALLKIQGEVETSSIRLEFTKARLRTPATAAQFAPQVITRTETGWTTETAPKVVKGQAQGEVAIVRSQFTQAYDRLADSASPGTGFDGKTVRKVRVDAIRDELRNRGFLEADDKGQIAATSRSHFRRAKGDLLAKKVFIEADGLIWRPN